MSSDEKPRPGRPPILTEVVETRDLTPHLIRVVVTGDDLRGFPAGEFADHYVKLQFPPPGADYEAPFDPGEIKSSRPKESWFRQRTFTVRDWDPEANHLTIDFVHHGDTGLAGPWAANARPGDLLQMVGPGGDYAPSPEAGWHLLAGDEAVIPAIAVALGRIPEGVPVHVFLEVDDEGGEVPLASPGDLRLSWLHRGEGSRESSRIPAAIAGLEFPDGEVHAFVHGEAGMVREVRKHLVLERDVPRQSLSATGYWKYSRTEEGWREDKPEWKRLAELDVSE
ncbi:MAG: siderophore-interacting protein [Thermoleophilia bacterium]|nr:siderophore-interacting protein [Thermoleophilia bacterium]